jgi:hypothetical protein
MAGVRLLKNTFSNAELLIYIGSKSIFLNQTAKQLEE